MTASSKGAGKGELSKGASTTTSKGASTSKGAMHCAPTSAPTHHRRSIRLKDYDYTQAGTYFITIVTHQRAHTLGTIRDGQMILSAWGTIVQEEWAQTAILRPYIGLDAFVIMPNHVHDDQDDKGTHLVRAQCIAYALS